MRTTKRFTPAVLSRFEREGRGQGTYEDYAGWHKVTRGDPASRGRSHLLHWRGRLRDLLSDGELGCQLFAAMLPDLDDSLEQHPLSFEPSADVRVQYGDADPYVLFPGTQELCRELGIKHPCVCDGTSRAKWVPSTDMVLVIRPPSGPRQVLAAAFKPAGWEGSRRQWELLQLERVYWQRRDAEWLLITPAVYDPDVVIHLRRIACWALAPAVSSELRQLACAVARAHPSASLTQVLQRVRFLGGEQAVDMQQAQRALWQAVWCGELPVDLRRSWRPHLPLKHISPEAFADLNPIAARRSAWI